MANRKTVLVLLSVDVPVEVPVAQVREHIAQEAKAAKGQFDPFNDWRSDVDVKLRDLAAYVRKRH